MSKRETRTVTVWSTRSEPETRTVQIQFTRSVLEIPAIGYRCEQPMGAVMKLTKFRRETLQDAASEHGTLTPSGSRAAGRSASNWWRAVQWLQDRGLVQRRTGTNLATATQAGLDLLASVDCAK